MIMAAAKDSPHLQFMTIIAEVIFVIVLAFMSDMNDLVGTVVMTFLLGLWLAFLVNAGPQLISNMKWRA